MKQHLITLASGLVAGLLTLGAPQASAQDYQPGVAEFSATHPDGQRNVVGHVWYPSEQQGEPGLLQDSKVWAKIVGHIDAPVAPGAFPVLLVSHGMYGNSLNQAWLAQEMARQGVISVLPNHPGTTTFDRDPDQARRLWLRATDLGVSLDALLADPKYAEHIDASRVAAAGHSLGGYTVMAASGARHDVAGFVQYCAIVPMRVDCGIMDMWNVGTNPADLPELQSDRSDPRIKTVIAMDLGGTQIFDKDSLASITRPVLILGSGRQDMLMQDVESRALAAALPDHNVTHVELEDAGHFDFMGECIPGGFEILAREEPGDEMVCIKGIEDRARQHDRMTQLILAHLRKTGVIAKD